MKRIITAALVCAVVAATACSGVQQQKKADTAQQKNTKIAKQYTCTMHPEVKADKPGLCPKCAMDLVEKED